jgi:hypothetical protein
MKTLWRDIREIIRIWRQRRLMRAILAEQHKLKATITHIGTINRFAPGCLQLVDWTFDASNGCLMNYTDENGTIYFMGYTMKELIEIHARRSEFVDANR